MGTKNFKKERKKPHYIFPRGIKKKVMPVQHWYLQDKDQEGTEKHLMKADRR